MSDELAGKRRNKEAKQQARQFLEAVRDYPFATIVVEGDHISLYVKDDVDGALLKELKNALGELEAT